MDRQKERERDRGKKRTKRNGQTGKSGIMKARKKMCERKDLMRDEQDIPFLQPKTRICVTLKEVSSVLNNYY